MESIFNELALYGSKNECARTDNVFSPISEVCDVMFFDRPGVAGAVLQTASLLINSLSEGGNCTEWWS